MYFPKLFEDATLKEYYDILKRRTLKVLDGVINGEDRRDEIDSITEQLLTYFAPARFSGEKSMEIQYDRQFEDMSLVISQNLHAQAKGMSVIEYYSAFEMIQTQARKTKKASKRAK